MIKTKYNVILFIIKIIVLSYINIVLAFADHNQGKNDQAQKLLTNHYIDQFKEIFEKIERDYVLEPNRQEMIDKAINGMLNSLDPYSEYITDEDLELFMQNQEGEFGGIGVEIMYEKNNIKVISAIDNLPAYNAGIKSGDLIIGVNGNLVANIGFNKAIKAMRGKAGSTVKLLIIKKESNKHTEIELKRQLVQIKSVKYEVENFSLGTIGYIRIATFNNKTLNDVKASIKNIELAAKNNNNSLQGLILDLRNNPGGLLEQALSISEYFLDNGNTIVTTKGKHKEDNKTIVVGRFSAKAPKIPLVVLINAGSASASEILAGALQDNKRAIIIGTTTFGKAIVQTLTRVNNRAVVKLTTAKYYTPSGKSINGKGINPDIFIENAEVKYDENKANLQYNMLKEDLEKYNDNTEKNTTPNKNIFTKSNKYKTDFQYARAYDVICGLIVTNQNLLSIKDK